LRNQRPAGPAVPGRGRGGLTPAPSSQPRTEPIEKAPCGTVDRQVPQDLHWRGRARTRSLDGCDERGVVTGGEVVRCVAQELSVCWNVRGHDRDPARDGLKRGEPEALEGAGTDDYAG